MTTNVKMQNGAAAEGQAKGKKYTTAEGPFEMIPTPAYELRTQKTSTYAPLLAKFNLRDEKDPFVQAASGMALTHNIILRGLNSIYLQADRVSEQEVGDFVGYCLCWVGVLEGHHNDEEEYFFPEVEKLTGEKGIMDGNIQQHEAFQAGLQAFTTYLTSLRSSPTSNSFSATHLHSLIDSFGPTVHRHLADEIPSLLALSRFPSLPITALAKGLSDRGRANAGKTTTAMLFFLSHDLGFEEGMWAHWPPIPHPVRWVLLRVMGWWNAAWWRFAPCGLDGGLRRLEG